VQEQQKPENRRKNYVFNKNKKLKEEKNSSVMSDIVYRL